MHWACGSLYRIHCDINTNNTNVYNVQQHKQWFTTYWSCNHLLSHTFYFSLYFTSVAFPSAGTVFSSTGPQLGRWSPVLSLYGFQLERSSACSIRIRLFSSGVFSARPVINLADNHVSLSPLPNLDAQFIKSPQQISLFPSAYAGTMQLPNRKPALRHQLNQACSQLQLPAAPGSHSGSRIM